MPRFNEPRVKEGYCKQQIIIQLSTSTELDGNGTVNEGEVHKYKRLRRFSVSHLDTGFGVALLGPVKSEGRPYETSSQGRSSGECLG